MVYKYILPDTITIGFKLINQESIQTLTLFKVAGLLATGRYTVQNPSFLNYINVSAIAVINYLRTTS